MKEKNRSQRPLGHYREYQHVCNEFRKEKGGKKDALKKYLKKKKGIENLKNLEDMNLHI